MDALGEGRSVRRGKRPSSRNREDGVEDSDQGTSQRSSTVEERKGHMSGFSQSSSLPLGPLLRLAGFQRV